MVCKMQHYIYVVFRYELSAFQNGLIVSSSLLGALLGSVGAFFVGEKLGRRKELLLASGLYGGLTVSVILSLIFFFQHW